MRKSACDIRAKLVHFAHSCGIAWRARLGTVEAHCVVSLTGERKPCAEPRDRQRSNKWVSGVKSIDSAVPLVSLNNRIMPNLCRLNFPSTCRLSTPSSLFTPVCKPKPGLLGYYKTMLSSHLAPWSPPGPRSSAFGAWFRLGGCLASFGPVLGPSWNVLLTALRSGRGWGWGDHYAMSRGPRDLARQRCW